MDRSLVNVTSRPLLSLLLRWVRLSCYCLIYPLVAFADVRINEFVASNGSILADEDGDFADWIELRNFGATTVSLEGWWLSDDPDRPFRWLLPRVDLPPGGYLLVWASGKDRAAIGGELHANFAISAEGESLLLTRPDGTLADFVGPVVLARDVSLGRSEIDPEQWLYFTDPTPGSPNGSVGYLGFLTAPVPSVMPGPVEFPLVLNFDHSDAEAVIRLTFDGALPDENSAIITEAIPIDLPESVWSGLAFIPTNPPEAASLGWFGWHAPTEPPERVAVLRARAERNRYNGGEGFAGTWFPQHFFPRSGGLPVVSLITTAEHFFGHERGIHVPGIFYEELGFNEDSPWGDPGANYFQRGPNWERPVHVEFFDGSSGSLFSAGHAGVRIHGGGSRALPQKSLRLYDRQPQIDGGALDYPFFASTGLPGYRALILRNAGQDQAEAFLRDPLSQAIVAHLEFDTQAYQPVVAFLNGEYWGLFNLREYLDEHWLAARYGVDPDALDRLEFGQHLFVQQGGNESFIEILTFLLTHDPTDPASYDWLELRMDMRNHIDWQIAHIFFANYDWPGNNHRMWRVRTNGPDVNLIAPADGRFRWLLFDLDVGLGLSGSQQYNMLTQATANDDQEWPAPELSTRLFRFLLQNERYRNDFILRFADLLNTAFRPQRTEAMLDAFSARIAPEMPNHIARWGYPASVGVWQNSLQRVRTFLRERPAYQWQHIVDFFDLDGTAGVLLDIPVGGSVRVNSVVFGPNQPGVEDYAPGRWHLQYPTGFSIEVEAIPLPGHRFAGWADTRGLESTRSLLVSENLHLVPEFVEDPTTWPILPHRLADVDYSFDHWDDWEPAGNSPPAMRFVQADVRDPALDAQPSGFWTLPYNLSSRSRVVGLNSDGIGFLNTANAQDIEGAGYIMGAIVALDTRGVNAVQVDWSAGTVLANERSYALRLQYRVGGAGAFRDVLDAHGQSVVYVTAVDGHRAALASALLPDDAIREPYVELLWRYYHIAGDTGTRAFLSLNRIDITVVSARLPDELFWIDAEWVDNETVWSPTLGYTYVADFPWIYSSDHRWQFHVGDYGANALLWDSVIGWIFTSAELYPYFGRIGLDGSFQWLFYLEGTREPRMFYVIGHDGVVSELYIRDLHTSNGGK